jgi:hypothetical protein
MRLLVAIGRGQGLVETVPGDPGHEPDTENAASVAVLGSQIEAESSRGFRRSATLSAWRQTTGFLKHSRKM